MTNDELTQQFETLKTDLSGLVNTGQLGKYVGILDNRIEKGEDGKYALVPLPKISSHEEEVRVILGALTPTLSADRAIDVYRDLYTGEVPKEVLACKSLLEETDNKCITFSRDVYFVLLLLRYEGILEFGRTPLCGDNNPDDFLRGLISDSGLDYSDTLLALLDYVREHSFASKGASVYFITEDPDETAGEKLDRSVMLLSLLSQDDIHVWGWGGSSDIINSFSAFFTGIKGVGNTVPYFMFLSPKLKELFNAPKIARKGDEADKDMAEHFSRICDELLGWNDGPVAMSDHIYNYALLQCANAGVSRSSWLYNADDIDTAVAAGVTHWLIDKLDDRVAELIMSREGYYLIADGALDLPKFYELRKYIVDNGYLTDVWYTSVDMDVERLFVCYEINAFKSVEPSEKIRFFNFCTGNAGLFDLLLPEHMPENSSSKYFTREDIADNAYKLNMNLYNSVLYAECKNPVFLSEIFKPIEGTLVETYKEFYDEKTIKASFTDDPLENYSEPSKAGRTWIDEGDMLFSTKSAFILRDSWPMNPMWVPGDPSIAGEDGKYLGIVVRKGAHAKAFSVDTDVANPWYIAYTLSHETWQFRDRANEDGTIEVKNLLKMFVDLPSLAEQKKIVEDVINKELERKKKQVGAVDTLFNLSHTIGLPANRIQSLLGNLKDICHDKPEVFSDLKKVGDNFDYILRVIDSTSKDLSGSKDPLKEKTILPILEKFISAFSSLPFGLDPVIDHHAVPLDVKLNINETLLSIMLDNILRNAHRHGFNKVVSKDNKVVIRLSLSKHDGRDYYMMSFCNNGNKLEPDFSIYDFITRGKKGTVTGNTGQGGYDIYQIIRKFDGKLGLRSSDEWNFILDVLIPVSGLDENTAVSKYTYGALV